MSLFHIFVINIEIGHVVSVMRLNDTTCRLVAATSLPGRTKRN